MEKQTKVKYRDVTTSHYYKENEHTVNGTKTKQRNKDELRQNKGPLIQMK